MRYRRMLQYLYALLCFLSIIGGLDTVLVRGFLLNESPVISLAAKVLYVVISFLYIGWVSYRIADSDWKFRVNLHDIFLSVFVVSSILSIETAGSIVSIRMILWMVFRVLRRTGITALAAQIRLNPARVLLLSFLFAILTGAILLMLPASTTDHKGASIIDALFTSTSATCVTGLIVKDTGTFFSGFGLSVIAILIQMGGLGIMTLSTLFAMIIGKRLGLRQEEQMRDLLDQSSYVEMYRMIVRIITITLSIEIIGGLFLFLRWLPDLGSVAALKNAAFHSISAFGNAGFSLYTDNLCSYADDWSINIIIMALIISGGLGFVVLNDIITNMKHYNPFSLRWRRLSVHSKLVLITSAFLIVVGTLVVFFFEFDNTMLGLSTFDKLLAAAFQSVTFRTAGFNTIDIGHFRDVTLFIGILFMFIGASPASTGGGIKTTTFAILILAVRSLLRSRNDVELFGRTILHQTVYKSIAIVLFSFTFLVVFSILLLVTQTGDFIDIVFEAASALGTVGLSTGITFQLDAIGKILITILMYVGRMGPLTVALALGDVKKVNIMYPTARISVG